MTKLMVDMELDMPEPEDPRKKVIERLKSLAEEVTITASSFTGQSKKNFLKKIEHGVWELQESVGSLDPVYRPSRVFDPSDPGVAANAVALTLVAQPRQKLAGLQEFYGAGVYAIYYKGGFESYTLLAGTEQPIYIGKADPATPLAADAITQGTVLYRRLKEHADSISDAIDTLSLEDFDVRALVVKSGYQQAAEARLISFFKPIWNKEIKICHGIGKHGDAAGTRQNKRSPWDTLHPGRSWAKSTEQDQKSVDVINVEIASHLQKHPPPASQAEFIGWLVDELKQNTPGALPVD